MAPNVIILDAAYIDRVAAAFRTHFSGEVQRELPKADLAQWLVCLALDSEFTGPDADVQCILIHDREAKVMQNVAPGNFTQEIDGKAFAEPGLGEFALACCPVERVTTTEDLCAESLEALLGDKEVKRVSVVFDFDGTTPESRSLTKRITKLCAKHATTPPEPDAPNAQPKDIMLFTMQPLEGGGFAQQQLGYSLLAALGVQSGEL